MAAPKAVTATSEVPIAYISGMLVANIKPGTMRETTADTRDFSETD